MNNLETKEGKINFLMGLFKYYQPTLTLPEQIGLLTLWEEVFVTEEEYEIAQVIKNKITEIQQNQNTVPQKGLVVFELVEKQKKPSFFKRFFIWVKKKLSRN